MTRWATLWALAGCPGAAVIDDPSPAADTDTDTDADSDTDADTDADTDTDAQIEGTVPWKRHEISAPGTVTFTELHYHPQEADLEWVELHNPLALDADLSGWSLAGAVSYTFAEDTLVPPGGYLVVAAVPSLLEAEALGPFSGRLSDDGARLELYSVGGRLIDTVRYGDDEPWPVAPDGTGATLAKIHPEAASDHAEHWTRSFELGGTPGAPNALDPRTPPVTIELIAPDGTWSYDASGLYPDPTWAEPAYDDSGWASGPAPLYAGEARSDALATLSITADNYYAAYLGEADGTDLRLVAPDLDGTWTTVDDFEIGVGPRDHLYVAAWEASAGSGGPQMAIAEVYLPFPDDRLVGTSAADFEWVLAPTGRNPGASPPAPPPQDAEIALGVAAATGTGAWAAPVDRALGASPWGATLGGAFGPGTRYVWGDTFADSSVTNVEDTYALFRSVAPLRGAPGRTELSLLPTTVVLRSHFDFDGDPEHAELTLACVLDDGARFVLNGTEVLRVNLPAGAIDESTLAAAPTEGAVEHIEALSTEPLVRGSNVLAVEVHQGAPADPDLLFGCSLTALIAPGSEGTALLLNELAADGDWVELLNASDGDRDASDLVLSSSAGPSTALSLGTLAPGALASAPLDIDVAPGDVLALTADGLLLDAVRVTDRLRGRAAGGGPWRFPSTPTPGAPNIVETQDDVVIHELMYHRAPVVQADQPWRERPEEWIELFNRGTDVVDLGGWTLDDAVAWSFPTGTALAPGAYLVVARDPATFALEHPGVPVLGGYAGGLDNGSDRVLLTDARGNPADEVRYHDGGRWPDAADGGGSSLELRDPWADNRAAEAWAPSDEAARSEWVTVRYRGLAEPSAVGPDGTWEELVLGLLDAGEVLIDDVSVVQDPDTAPLEGIWDGGFDDASRWRLLGTHRHSAVVEDPDDPGNRVLHLVATGPTEHMHNHAETTLRGPIVERVYEISFRARWLSGSNQLHSRLYFQRLPHVALLPTPEQAGTPGAPNSTRVDNLGPTFDDLRPDVAVPPPGQPLRISVTAADPDGVAAVTLWSAVDGQAPQARAMTEEEPDRWVGWLEGEPAGTLVQLYVEATDTLGATSMFPARGPDARALLQFDDGRAASHGLHNLRLLMTEADSDWLLDDPNLMSNDLLGATVVYDESEVFWDVGVRAKGSERGRPQTPRLGFGLRFHSEQPFRGSHQSVLIDRSEGVGYGQREVLLNLVAARAGLVSAEHNDLVHVMTPRSAHTGPAELQLDRFSGLVLASQFVDGGDGDLYDYELVYYPTTTHDGTAEGLKLPQPDRVVGTPVRDLGPDPEAYRWSFMLQRHEDRDDFGPIMDLCETFSLPDAAFRAQVGEVIDTDQWLRAFAFASLAGAIDNYGGDGAQHNARFYVRPIDGRVLYFPHDLDFFGSATMPLVNNSDLSRLLQSPVGRRTYHQHLHDILSRAYNPGYLGRWCTQLGQLLPGQDFAGHCAFVGTRAEWAWSGSPDAVTRQFPPVDFAITTAGGADFETTESRVELEGVGWVDVREIGLGGFPLDVTWIDSDTWRVSVAVALGYNEVTLVATDLGGAVVGTDSIGVTVVP